MTRLRIGRVLDVVEGVRVLRALVLSLTYCAVLALSLWLAYQLRFDFDVPDRFQSNAIAVYALVLGVKLFFLLCFRQFDGLLSYFSLPDLKRLIAACASGSFVLAMLWLMYGIEIVPPRAIILTDFVLGVMAFSGLRLGFRQLRHAVHSKHTGRVARRVGIVGAGNAGAMLAKELLEQSWLALEPIAFFDDHRDRRTRVHGIQVVGRPESICKLKGKLGLEEVIIAMPSAPAKRIKDILLIAHQAGLPCRTVPALEQLITGGVSVSSLRPVQIEDLLGRSPVVINADAVRHILSGQVVMVTGAGGSIGSELCRQILSFGPSALLLVERSEPQLFVVEQELRGAPNAAVVVPLVGDVTERRRMREIFQRYHPHAVFHAAAHKHVPMMEAQPAEAIRNNIFGTARLAELAIENAVERFVLISTDKAVNPTSVMGATKRFAEIYLQSLTTRGCATKFMAVRFGNVLGSSGSVVPTFTRQIAAGGPITVTHPAVTRFFMTIPEAVILVLQSAALGKAGNIFVLDMGKPIKILDLAMQMIALSGLRPHEDIEIKFTGLRPGEKLYEELSHSYENVTFTAHPKIMEHISNPQSHHVVQLRLDELAAAIHDGSLEPDDLKRLLAKTVTEYTPFQAPIAAPVAPPPERAGCRGDSRLIRLHVETPRGYEIICQKSSRLNFQ